MNIRGYDYRFQDSLKRCRMSKVKKMLTTSYLKQFFAVSAIEAGK